MAEAIKRTQADVVLLNTPGKFRFGPNLQLQVSGPNAKSWLCRYSLNGKSRWKGLGSARDVTLAQARKLADELRVTKLRKGIDPLAEEQEAADRSRQAAAKAIPFRQRVDGYLAQQEAIPVEKGGWKNPKHRAQWRSTLEAYAFPIIGDLSCGVITVAHIVDVLAPIWAEKFTTARRVRGRIEKILDFAADPDDLLYRNPAKWTPQLQRKLPALGKVKPTHHASLPYSEIAAFVADLRTRGGPAAMAMEFTIVTAARTNETLGVRWDEIDRPSAVWTIPASRMKGGRFHRVPLSVAALTVLDRAQAAYEGPYLFPSSPKICPLSNMAMLNLLKRMKRPDITIHGFRSSFRTWAAEETDFAREIVEAALAHQIEDDTEAAYQRGDLLKKRRELMQAWSNHCDASAEASQAA